MNVGIIGLGRFGTLLYDILKNDHQVTTYDKGTDYASLTDCESVFLCVPISQIDSVLQQIKLHVSTGTTVIDTCSVKLYPVECMQKHLDNNIAIIATHPLFGPDSYYETTNNRMMMHSVRNSSKTSYTYWKDYFTQKGVTVIEMTPDEHDRYAAHSQGITHLLGRTLYAMQIGPTPIDTLGFARLLGIMNQTCNDSQQLFQDLLHYNPYTQDVLQQLKTTLDQLT